MQNGGFPGTYEVRAEILKMVLFSDLVDINIIDSSYPAAHVMLSFSSPFLGYCADDIPGGDIYTMMLL